uniref:Uncharacterized protein n=1 Tax=Cacopsylla melanoneura TaxID=428564 RepID=A0A8D9DVX0_9HEMI
MLVRQPPTLPLSVPASISNDPIKPSFTSYVTRLRSLSHGRTSHSSREFYDPNPNIYSHFKRLCIEADKSFSCTNRFPPMSPPVTYINSVCPDISKSMIFEGLSI